MEQVIVTKRRNTQFCIQWTAAIGVFMLLFQIGVQIGWVSPNLARLQAEDSEIPVTLNQVSWIASLVPLGGLGGSILGSIIVEYFGSKKAVHLSIFISGASWVFLIVADDVGWIYAARVLGGISCSMTYSCFSLYLGEISEPTIRGTLVSVAACGNPFGIIIGTIAETYLPMKISSSIYLVQALVALILFMWLKDSPYHLIKINNLEDAKKSIAFYHTGCDVDEELNEMSNFVKANSLESFGDKLRELNSPPVRKAMFIIIMVFALPHISGMLNIMGYMELILNGAKSHLIKPEEFVIYANITNCVISFLTVKLVDVVGRRFLFVVSGIGTAIGIACLGIHFNLLDLNFDAQKLQWLPVVAIMTFVITYTIGFSPVPSTILSELFPQNIKSVGGLFAGFSASFFGFIVTKAYQPIVDSLGQAYVFWIHAGLALLAVPLALFLMPETKGKTFQEIQNELIKK